ncbi:MAG: HlyD family efflux transporter periplasmic adaptor subunit [Anaerovoracaceae bacterium]|jgi:putative membrane fusion protein
MKNGAAVKSKRNLKRIAITLFIISVTVLAAIIYLLPKVTDALTKTWVLKYDRIQVADDVTCYFVRNESVYTAKNGGKIEYHQDECSMTRRDARILDVGGQSYTASENGTVSYYSDGLEDIFTVENINKLQKKDIDNQNIEVFTLKRESALAGEPLYKLVDTWEWFAIFWVKAENIAKYKKDHTVYIDLPLGRIKGTIWGIIDEGDEFKVILRFTRYYEDMCKIRREKIRVVTYDYEGLLVRNKSIGVENEQPGVYVRDLSGNYNFVPVYIITSDGEYSLLKANSFNRTNEDGTTDWVNTVKAYDEILNNPKNFK